MNVTFRKFVEEDRENFLNMSEQFFSSPATVSSPDREILSANFANAMDDNGFFTGYMFCDGDKSIGYSLVSLKYETEVGGYTAWIEDLFISDGYRGNGIGSEFLRFIEKAYTKKAIRLRLEVCPENTGAVKLYQRFGFDFLGYSQMIKDFR